MWPVSDYKYRQVHIVQTKERDVKYCGVRKDVVQLAEPRLNAGNTAHLMRFISERYRIHVRKDILKKPRPWTENPVLQQYKFTNVFREDDRVSRAVIELVSHNDGLSFEEKVLNTFLLRSWNNPDTFTDFGGPFRAKEIYRGLELKERVRPIYYNLLLRDPDRKWWSSAYNQGGTKYAWKFPDGEGFSRAPSEEQGRKYEDYEPDIPLRVFHIGPWLKERKVFRRIVKAESQKQAYEIIREIRGFAEFLAYQVFVDLTYIPEFPFSENEFVIAGPGCKRGLDLVFDDYNGMTHEEALFWLRDNLDTCFEELHSSGADVPKWNPERLFKHREPYDRCINIMSLENCFCELSKYVKAVNGTGRPRNTYKQTTKPWNYMR